MQPNELILRGSTNCDGAVSQRDEQGRPVFVQISVFAPGDRRQVVDFDCKHMDRGKCALPIAGNRTLEPLPMCVVSAERDQLTLDEVESPLTTRQREALEGAARGESYKEIAKELTVKPGTIRDHLEHARERLGATSVDQAVHKAVTDGVIPRGDLERAVARAKLTDVASPTQREVLDSVALTRNGTYNEIGERLGISRTSVKTQFDRLFDITGIRDKTALVAINAASKSEKTK